MYNKTIIIIGVVLLIATMSFGIYQYNNSDDEIKFCDSINIKSDYDGEPICYEKPITDLNKKTKLVRINNNG
jgi:hypothetical protein